MRWGNLSKKLLNLPVLHSILDSVGAEHEPSVQVLVQHHKAE